MLPCPLVHPLVLRMPGMMPCLKEASISFGTTGIFRWAGTFSCQAARDKPEIVGKDRPVFICSDMLNMLNSNSVHPTVSAVIFVGQFESFRPDRRINFAPAALSHSLSLPPPL